MELSHLSKRRDVSACRAFRKISSRSMPAGTPHASLRSRAAKSARRSGSGGVCWMRGRLNTRCSLFRVGRERDRSLGHRYKPSGPGGDWNSVLLKISEYESIRRSARGSASQACTSTSGRCRKAPTDDASFRRSPWQAESPSAVRIKSSATSRSPVRVLLTATNDRPIDRAY